MSNAPPQGVDSILTIDLGAITANYDALRAQAPTAEVAAVVKADAYGLGADQVARALFDAGCRTFFIATIAEGIELRQSLTEPSIAVLNGPGSDGAGLCLQHNLTPVLNSPAQVEAWRQSGDSKPAILHVDTGMSRLGLSPSEVDTLAADKSQLDGVTISHIMSHLACAEDQATPLNKQQLDLFKDTLAKLRPIAPNANATLANSSATYLGHNYHFDLIRPGAALYGLAPIEEQPNPLKQTIQLHSRILQVREIDESATVGYGASHRASRTSRIATVAAGYADGYPRSLSNCGFAYVGSARVPVVGRVSMDLTTLDVTDLSEEKARPGTFVELIGEHVRTDDIGACAGTIGYEILTRLGRRYHRVYR